MHIMVMIAIKTWKLCRRDSWDNAKANNNLLKNYWYLRWVNSVIKNLSLIQIDICNCVFLFNWLVNSIYIYSFYITQDKTILWFENLLRILVIIIFFVNLFRLYHGQYTKTCKQLEIICHSNKLEIKYENNIFFLNGPNL